MTSYNPPDVPLSVLHHDHEILIVDKPAGLLSVPGKLPGLEDCLMARVRQAFPEALLVHRLDRDTSGVIIFAVTQRAQRHLSRQFEQRRSEKRYIARVAGRLEGAGTVDLPIATDMDNRPRQKICHERGRPSQTGWEVIGHEAGDVTRLALSPVTGRSHQLRVHMLALGHPILGDPLYAPDTAAEHPRLMLHAESLRLRHPDGGRFVTFTAPCPF